MSVHIAELNNRINSSKIFQVIFIDWIEWTRNSYSILYKCEFKNSPAPIATKCVGIIKASVEKVV